MCRLFRLSRILSSLRVHCVGLGYARLSRGLGISTTDWVPLLYSILLSHLKFATVSSNDSELGKESSPGRATGWVMRTIGGARRNMWSSSGCGAAAAVAQGAFGRCGVNSLACDMAVGGAGSAGLAVIHRKTIVKPAPSGERQHMDSIEAVGITCHHYGTRRRAGCNAWRASRQRLLHVVTTTVGRIFAGRAAAHGERRRSRYCLSSLRQRAV